MVAGVIACRRAEKVGHNDEEVHLSVDRRVCEPVNLEVAVEYLLASLSLGQSTSSTALRDED